MEISSVMDAETALRHGEIALMGEIWGSIVDRRNAAAVLAKLSPFIKRAMEWGEWYNQNFKTTDEWSMEEAQLILAYRELLARLSPPAQEDAQ